MPGRHPDDDLLADLAADVLPADRARAVEAHVVSCDRCAGLLEDAERVRSLLLADDPGPVPLDVWHRVEAALAAEGANSTSSSTGADPAHRLHDNPLHDADPLEDADPLDDPARWGRRPVRSDGGSGSRRDARAGSTRRWGPLLLAAAAVLAVAAVTGSVKLLSGTGPSGASGGAGMAEGSQSSALSGAGAAASRAPIVRSGRDYHAATLAAEASALLAGTTGAASTATTGGDASKAPGAGGASSEAASPPAAAPRSSRMPTAQVPPDTGATDITNPARLAACLAALGVTPDRLVAVDLARYDGREAAILLVAATEGTGHEVWAVERTCAPKAEGALNYIRLSK